MSSTCRKRMSVKSAYSKYALKAYDDCYHRAIQRTLLLEHRKFRDLVRVGFGKIISHIESGDVRDGITEREVRVDAGWRRGKGHERILVQLQNFKSPSARAEHEDHRIISTKLGTRSDKNWVFWPQRLVQDV